MKHFLGFTILALTILVALNFDLVVVFLLSGFIPGVNVSLAPSTMIAVMLASALTLLALRRRHAVYQACLSLYDAFWGKKSPATKPRPSLPKRRYQEL